MTDDIRVDPQAGYISRDILEGRESGLCPGSLGIATQARGDRGKCPECGTWVALLTRDMKVVGHRDPRTSRAVEGLTFRQLREANVERLRHFPGHEPGTNPWSAADWAVALTGEVGELCNMLKKLRRGSAYPGMQMPSPDDLAEELADIATYLDLLASYLRVDLGEAIVRKFNQVSERWDLPDRL